MLVVRLRLLPPRVSSVSAGGDVKGAEIKTLFMVAWLHTALLQGLLADCRHEGGVLGGHGWVTGA